MAKEFEPRSYIIVMNHPSDVLVIGAGVIGVCAAYYLQQEGRRVVILEKEDVASGSSFGNAGWLVPSHSVPLAQPGAFLQAVKWMFNPESPFYIKLRPSLELASWLWKFRSVANERAVRTSLPAVVDFSKISLELYEDLVIREEIDCYYEQKGLLTLYETTRGLEIGTAEATLLEEYGVSSKILSSSEVTQLEPAVKSRIIGGVYHSGDAHLKPDNLVREIAARFLSKGGVIHTGVDALGFTMNGDSISSVKTNRGQYSTQQVVLATGAWSSDIAKLLKLNLPIQPGKGYSVTFDDPMNPPSIPIMLAEAKVGVTPMGSKLRLAGTLELSGLNTYIDPKRVRAILRAGERYLLSDFSKSTHKVWCGMRPLSPDNLPLIGRAERLSNLIVATGHSMTGVTLGAATGKLVSQIAIGAETIVDPLIFSPTRFG